MTITYPMLQVYVTNLYKPLLELASLRAQWYEDHRGYKKMRKSLLTKNSFSFYDVEDALNRVYPQMKELKRIW
jgi:hypothetical protein